VLCLYFFVFSFRDHLALGSFAIARAGIFQCALQNWACLMDRLSGRIVFGWAKHEGFVSLQVFSVTKRVWRERTEGFGGCGFFVMLCWQGWNPVTSYVSRSTNSEELLVMNRINILQSSRFASRLLIQYGTAEREREDAQKHMWECTTTLTNCVCTQNGLWGVRAWVEGQDVVGQFLSLW